MILGHVIEQGKALDEEYKEYYALINREGINLDTDRVLSKRQKVRSRITNLADTVKNQEGIFKNKHTTEWYEEFTHYINLKVDPPSNLKSLFTEKDNLSFFHVIKVERNYEEHPDKYDQIRYVMLADYLLDDSYFQLYDLISFIVNRTTRHLSVEECNILLGNNVRLHRWLPGCKNEIRKAEQIIMTDSRVSQGVRDVFQSFMNFELTGNNIVVIPNEQEN